MYSIYACGVVVKIDIRTRASYPRKSGKNTAKMYISKEKIQRNLKIVVDKVPNALWVVIERRFSSNTVTLYDGMRTRI